MISTYPVCLSVNIVGWAQQYEILGLEPCQSSRLLTWKSIWWRNILSLAILMCPSDAEMLWLEFLTNALLFQYFLVLEPFLSPDCQSMILHLKRAKKQVDTQILNRYVYKSGDEKNLCSLTLISFGLVPPSVPSSAQRVPDTRPEPEFFSNTRSIPEFYSESLGISEIKAFSLTRV